MPEELPNAPRRTVRSFVMRAGRITAAQQRALEQWWPVYGLEYSAAPLDLATSFGRAAPCTLEIGFGDGEHLAARAAAEPERNFIGVEVHRPGVGHLLLAAAQGELRNVRIIAHDAVEVLNAQIAPGSLDEVQLLFADPWPKKRHHKRRIVQPPFVALLASRLRPGGRLHLATDWVPYAEHMLAVLEAEPALRNSAGSRRWAEQPETRAATRFERRGTRLGHEVRELLFERV
ncbi:MAG: tRNA (guanosine(46)-N7)-methyltransferase TrmB [Steroidobacteraceae bacterium]